MFRRFLTVIIFLFSIISFSAFAAGTKTTNINVTATVAANCLVTTTNDLSFGAYDPNNTTPVTPQQANLQLTCTKNEIVNSIKLNGGLAQATQRYMVGNSGGDHLLYNLYEPTLASGTNYTTCSSANPVLWTKDVSFGPLNPSQGIFVPINVAVCGQIPMQQDVAPDGTYKDIVIATVDFQ